MPGEENDEPEMDARSRQASPATRLSTVGVIRAALRRIRRDPVLAVPFAVVGVLVALADWLRQSDPIPVAAPDAFSDSVSLQYSVLPQGTARTVRQVDALIDLTLPYLLWAVGLELVVALAVGLAGWLTISRTLDSRSHPRTLGRYLLALGAIVSLPQLLGVSPVNIDNFLLGLALLAALLFVFVRLFLVPAFLVTGSGFVAALRQSARRSRGHGMTFAGLIIVVGLASWGLATVPIAGGLLSTALVAPVHAVALGIISSPETDDVDATPSTRPGDRDGNSDGDR
ncbi:hypothetical protein ACFR9U_20305 [Halorientalis brevis]|uniref:Sec-independent protein translocase protein TatC n=1 Tax=Halorientalis brevis TaxID=1126241 RepID=A0ABD6CH94_9EURY|nr:hypothetical protein [Halorientalis brevis]